MILLLVVILPLLAALAIVVGARKAPPERARNGLLAAAAVHLLLCMATLRLDVAWTTLIIRDQEWLALDRFSNSICYWYPLFFSVWPSIAAYWLKAKKQLLEIEQAESGITDHERLMPEWIFLPCLLAFLSAMTLAICATNLALMWVAIEATTLISAPLICLNCTATALEAMWKYLLICVVGIGLALLGTFFIRAGWRSPLRPESGDACCPCGVLGPKLVLKPPLSDSGRLWHEDGAGSVSPTGCRMPTARHPVQ